MNGFELVSGIIALESGLTSNRRPVVRNSRYMLNVVRAVTAQNAHSRWSLFATQIFGVIVATY
eukprot:scaffold501827_cov16-Prasinocladus_malaysianus.AAC.2